MRFLLLLLTACPALSLAYNISLISHVTGWAGDTVNITSTVPTNNDTTIIIIWLRQLDDRSEAEVVAHDHQVLLANADAGQTKFQVDVERTDRTTESQLTMFNSSVSDSATFTCVVTDTLSGEEDTAKSMMVIFEKVNLINQEDDLRSQTLLPFRNRAARRSQTYFVSASLILISIFVSR